MKNLPVEIENKIWEFYYSHIYYKNVILELKNRITICDQIVNNKINGYSHLISLLEFTIYLPFPLNNSHVASSISPVSTDIDCDFSEKIDAHATKLKVKTKTIFLTMKYFIKF